MGPNASHNLGGTRGEELHLVLPQCMVTPTIVRDIAGQCGAGSSILQWRFGDEVHRTSDEKSCRETDRFSVSIIDSNLNI